MFSTNNRVRAAKNRDSRAMHDTGDVPRHQYVSLALLILVLLGDVTLIVFGVRHALDYSPWLAPGPMAVLVGGVALGTALLYLLYDLFAKYGLSGRRHTGAYEATIFNLTLAYAFKWALLVLRVAAFVAFVVYWAKNGWSYAVPATCAPADCDTLMRWLAINSYLVYVTVPLLLFGIRTAQIYVVRESHAFGSYLAAYKLRDGTPGQ